MRGFACTGSFRPSSVASRDTFSRPGEGNNLHLNQHTDRIFDQRLEYLDKLGTQSAIHRAVVG